MEDKLPGRLLLWKDNLGAQGGGRIGRRTPSADSQLSANDEVQAWAADQFRLLSSRDHRAIRALI